MPESQMKTLLEQAKPFYVRTLTKSGRSRYLSLGTIVPKSWEAVKVTVDEIDLTHCVLRLEQIK